MKTKAIKPPRNWQELKAHPLSALVEFGAGIDIEALAGYMRVHGYDCDEAIVLHDGMILDGRHRFAAAIKAGIVPTFRQFVGRNAMAYAAKKLFRQHLTASQRAVMAETLTKICLPANSAEAQICASADSGSSKLSPTLEQAAATMNVSPRSVDAARVVEEYGTPAQKRAVRVGTATVSKVANEILAVRRKRPKPRHAGDDTDQEQATRAADKNMLKNGAERFVWKNFDAAWGALLRQVDMLGNAYGCKDTPDAEALREKLDLWKHAFKSLYRRVAGQEPPRG